ISRRAPDFGRSISLMVSFRVAQAAKRLKLGCPADIVAAWNLKFLPVSGLHKRGADDGSLPVLLEVAWQQ
ncbi:MAG TPA: hypothetical protein VEC95_04675, partial [Terriglobales bacterium]|nr:hypothetical protein [Terriglobales bacterium]